MEAVNGTINVSFASSLMGDNDAHCYCGVSDAHNSTASTKLPWSGEFSDCVRFSSLMTKSSQSKKKNGRRSRGGVSTSAATSPPRGNGSQTSDGAVGLDRPLELFPAGNGV